MAEEQIAPTEEIQATPKEEEIASPVEEKKEKPWFKLLLFSILGIIVAVGLVFAGYKFGQKQVQPGPQPTPTPEAVSTPTPTVVATPTPDPTANWKIYTNTKYGYSVKYPPEMESEELEPSATGLTAHNFIVWGPTQMPETEFYDGLSVTLEVVTNPEELSLRDFADKASQPTELGERESFEEIQVGSLRGYKAVRVGPGRFAYIFLPYKTPDKVVEIIATWGGKKKEEYQDNFDLMLSTFKFLPSAGSGQGE